MSTIKVVRLALISGLRFLFAYYIKRILCPLEHAILTDVGKNHYKEVGRQPGT